MSSHGSIDIVLLQPVEQRRIRRRRRRAWLIGAQLCLLRGRRRGRRRRRRRGRRSGRRGRGRRRRRTMHGSCGGGGGRLVQPCQFVHQLHVLVVDPTATTAATATTATTAATAATATTFYPPTHRFPTFGRYCYCPSSYTHLKDTKQNTQTFVRFDKRKHHINKHLQTYKWK